MKKKAFLLVSLVAIVIVVGLLGYRWSVRRNLKNPFDEMVYSETQSTKVTLFTPLSTVVNSDRHFKADDDFVSLNYDSDLLNGGELMYAFMSKSVLSFTYDKEIEEGIKLVIVYSYSPDKTTITQKIYLSDQTGEETIYKGEELLEKLSIYGKDIDWLESTSQKVLEEYILGLWFEKGSGRYSLENLGDLKIQYDEVLNKGSHEE